VKIKDSIKKGLGFGFTSGIITTLGLIIGLSAGTHSKIAVIGGILTIAFADALSDSLGIHISEESTKKNSKYKRGKKEIWESTFSTLFSKIFFALTFLIPVLFFQLNLAVIISIIWGLTLITFFSYLIAKFNKTKSSSVIIEHLTITIIVILLSKIIGNLISRHFT
jgi:VIT1/CCC1 family predicted Fe2+/Mn2+ transporter